MIRKNIAKLATRLKSKGRYKHLKLIKYFEFKSVEECLSFQNERLFDIIQYSIKNVPYYSKIAENKGFKISKKSINEDIKKFPILTKEIIKSNFNKLKSVGFKGHYYKNHTGGSTGQPVDFLQSENYNEENKAIKIFFDEIAGRKEGDFIIKIWGSEAEVLNSNQGLSGFVNENILNMKILNSFNMSKDKMLEYVKILNKKKPVVVEGYVQSLYEFAKFIKINKINVYSPRGVIAAAGTLHEKMKILIEEVFKCKVYNQYGSRDAGMIAFSCGKQEGLHLNILSNYIEILDKNLKPCLPGETGKVYVTELNNFVMPLIRYDIGDFITLPKKGEEICSCGRGFPLIKRVEGRETSIFRTKDGRVIPGEFFIHFIGVVFNKGFISKFQVIQESYEQITVKIVLEDEVGFNENKKKIVDSIKKVMGKDCRVKFDLVDEIESLKSGKYLYTYSKIK